MSMHTQFFSLYNFCCTSSSSCHQQQPLVYNGRRSAAPLVCMQGACLIAYYEFFFPFKHTIKARGYNWLEKGWHPLVTLANQYRFLASPLSKSGQEADLKKTELAGRRSQGSRGAVTLEGWVRTRQKSLGPAATMSLEMYFMAWFTLMQCKLIFDFTVQCVFCQVCILWIFFFFHL